MSDYRQNYGDASMSTTVALVQLEVSDRQTEGVRRRDAAAAVQTAADEGAALVMLPELWPSGAFNTDAMAERDARDFTEFVAFVTETAASAGVWLHGGSDVEVGPDGRRFNTAVIADSGGEVVARYRKQYLWGGDEGEAAVLDAGTELLTIPTPLGTTGIATCYELRFPELFRALVDRGAQTYAIASGWPAARIEHWRTLLRARAIENQSWVLGVNCVGNHNGVQMGGYSAVINPWGEVITEGSADTAEILYADVDPETVEMWRSKFGWLADRKPCC